MNNNINKRVDRLEEHVGQHGMPAYVVPYGLSQDARDLLCVKRVNAELAKAQCRPKRPAKGAVNFSLTPEERQKHISAILSVRQKVRDFSPERLAAAERELHAVGL